MSELLSRVSTALADRYRILREIGRGGMATVFLAEDVKHRRLVAVKVMLPDLSVALTGERFLREIEVAARLTHPHILALHDSGEADGLLYYVMPFIDGETLRSRLQREGPLPVDEVLRIVRQVADALDHAHAAGIIHRDIKPENLLFASGHALVGDFGIARVAAAAGADRLTATGLSIGTPAYMSPEQSAGTALDARSDLYSLACVTYEMLGGTPPFTGPNPQAVMARHAIDAMPSLRTVRPALSAEVDRVLSRALAKVPADRYATAAQFVAALEHACTTEPVAHAAGLRGLLDVRHPRARVTLAGAAIAAAALIAVLLWLGQASASRLASVAVLPFDNLAVDSTDQHVVEGVQNALVGALGQVGPLRVIWTEGRRARDRLAQADLTHSELARELNTDGFVTGGVQRSGDSVWVQVRLLRADGQLTWSQDFGRDLRNMLALCGEIAQAIARRTRNDVAPAVAARLNAQAQIDPETYEAYLRGMYHLDQQTPEDTRRGIQYLEDAVQRDPANAYAYAALAQGYATAGHSPASPADAWQRARAAAERALTLNRDLAEAHAVLANVRTYYEYDWAGAESAFRQALSINPNLAFAHYHYSWFLTLFDRFDEAIAEHKRAQELDPLSPANTAHLASTYVWAERPDEAFPEVQKVLQRDSLHPGALANLGIAHAAKGDFHEAIAAGEKAARVNPAWRIHLGITYARAGRPDETRRLIDEIETAPGTAYRNFMLACLHAALGNNDEAFRLLEIDPAHAWRPWVRNWPGLDNLRADPRFPALMRRFNLPT